MTDEQAQLIIAIVLQLDNGAVTGEWPYEQCHHCNGKSGGYRDSQDFTHHSECVVLKIKALRQTTWK